MSELIDMLKRHEGEVRSEDGRHVAYQCPDGKWTIGIGRNVDEDGGIGLSDEEVDFLLKNDLDRCEAELNTEYVWFRTLEFMDSRWARQVGNRALELTDIIKAGTYV